MTNRREFMAGAIAALSAGVIADEPKKLELEVGITTSSLSGHLVARPGKGQFSLLELPKIIRNELDMRVIDLNTSSLGTRNPTQRYLEKLREAAEKAGCVFTNMKLNQRDLDMNSSREDIRNHALAEYKRSIDAAAHLGCRWARPLPQSKRPVMKLHIDSYQRLSEYAATKQMQMLVENFGWMSSDPESVVKLIKAINRNVAASPDTGNWVNDEIRIAGLTKTFPSAVTCDFKARQLGPNGEHKSYDLKQCFDIGWKSGFRGPWCLEHANRDREKLFQELLLLRNMLKGWMGQSR